MESVVQSKNSENEIELILKLSNTDFKKFLTFKSNEEIKKLISTNQNINEEEEEKNENENNNFKAIKLSLNDVKSHFLNKDFNKLSSPEEIISFLSKYIILIHFFHLQFIFYAESFRNLFGENFDFDTYFFYNYKSRSPEPKPIFFDLCQKKELGPWIAYAFMFLSVSMQTKENFEKIPKEYQIFILKILNLINWELIDCLSTEQKIKLFDEKIITEKGLLNKKFTKINLIGETIFLAILTAGLITSCIFLPAITIVWPIILAIAVTSLGICTMIVGITCLLYNLHKINKFNEEVEIGQSETAVPSNDTNNSTVAVENENAQGNDSQNQTKPQSPMDSQKTCLLI